MIFKRLERGWRRIYEQMSSAGLDTFRRLLRGATVGWNGLPAVILCYTCRRRITADELIQGLHTHAEDGIAVSPAQLVSSDLMRPRDGMRSEVHSE